MDERLTTIKGIGPGREKQLHKLGITNITSLLTYFPRTYEDRRTIYRIGDLKSGMTGGVVGNVIAVQEKRPRPRLSILEVVIADGTGPLKIVLFNQGYKKNFYKKGQRLYAYGKAEFQYGSMQMNTPQIENLGDGMEPDEVSFLSMRWLMGYLNLLCGHRCVIGLQLIMSYLRFYPLRFGRLTII